MPGRSRARVPPLSRRAARPEGLTAKDSFERKSGDALIDTGYSFLTGTEERGRRLNAYAQAQA